MAKQKTKRYKEFKARLERNRTKFRRKDFASNDPTSRKYQRDSEKDVKVGVYDRGY